MLRDRHDLHGYIPLRYSDWVSRKFQEETRMLIKRYRKAKVKR